MSVYRASVLGPLLTYNALEHYIDTNPALKTRNTVTALAVFELLCQVAARYTGIVCRAL